MTVDRILGVVILLLIHKAPDYIGSRLRGSGTRSYRACHILTSSSWHGFVSAMFPARHISLADSKDANENSLTKRISRPKLLQSQLIRMTMSDRVQSGSVELRYARQECPDPRHSGIRNLQS